MEWPARSAKDQECHKGDGIRNGPYNYMSLLFHSRGVMMVNIYQYKFAGQQCYKNSVNNTVTVTDVLRKHVYTLNLINTQVLAFHLRCKVAVHCAQLAVWKHL